MAIASVTGAMTRGVEGVPVTVEADLSAGLPGVQIVGLADTAVGESRARVRTAITNSQLQWPLTRVTIGLSPASVQKKGTGLDLAIALAILAVTGQVSARSDVLAMAELGLDGSVRGVPGAIVAAQCAREQRLRLMVAESNAAQAALVPGVEVLGVVSLAHAVAVLNGNAEPSAISAEIAATPVPPADYADVHGHHEAKRSLQIAAAGGHHVLFIGPAGVGKSMLSERFPGLLPALDDAAALEVTSVASLLGEHIEALHRTPPFVAPHHTTTQVAMIGGTSPGLVTRAHRGVLFLDEVPEFERRVLDTLRQPLEAGTITVSRADKHVTMPARFQLILAANPCPCGWSGTDDARCTCSSLARRRYLQRISGPLADRIDIRSRLTQPTLVDHSEAGESTAAMVERVLNARARAARRFADTGWNSTAEVPAKLLASRWPMDSTARDDLWRAVSSNAISLRGADRVARLAWTIADLEGLSRPNRECVAEAITLRGEW